MKCLFCGNELTKGMQGSMGLQVCWWDQKHQVEPILDKLKRESCLDCMGRTKSCNTCLQDAIEAKLARRRARRG